MPVTGTALLIALGVGLAMWGGPRVVHGVKHVTHVVFHHKPPIKKSN